MADIGAAVMQLISEHGGTAALLQQLEQGGLGNVASTWVQPGQNQGISSAQLGSSLDPNAVEATAQAHGLSSSQLLEMAAQYLPQVIDHFTPNGDVPHGSHSEGLIDSMLQMFRPR
jgi:uncharacterized protein YidB (DUF937 family)